MKIVVIGANHAGTAAINTILDNYKNAEVVVNPNNGKIISVNPTSSAKARQLLSKEK